MEILIRKEIWRLSSPWIWGGNLRKHWTCASGLCRGPRNGLVPRAFRCWI